jgi:hypothetical protein
LNISEDDAIKFAENFLIENDLLPDDFKFYQTAKTTFNGDNIVGITVGFTREIDKHEVIGLSKITVSIDSEGIYKVVLAYSNYDKRIKMKTMSHDEFKKALYGDNVFWYVDEEITGHIKAE